MDVTQSASSTATQFTVGSVLSRSFWVLKKNPLFFLGLPFLALMSIVLLGAATAFLDILPEVAIGIWGIMHLVVSVVLYFILQGAIAYSVYQVLYGQRISVGASLSRASGHLAPLCLVALATSLGILLGTSLFVIPGIMLACCWAVVAPVFFRAARKL